MFKKIISFFKKLPVVITGLSLLTTLGFASVATAVSSVPPVSPSSSTNNNLPSLIGNGNTEIARRLTTLNKLTGLINASEKLSAADKVTLNAKASSEISGLTTDKSTLDAATSLSAAQTAAQSIFTEYRVYALVVPQVFLTRAADRQQLIESKLTALASDIMSTLSTSATSVQTTELASLNLDIKNASILSIAVETAVTGLNPSDYNADHTLLQQYYQQLTQAKSDIAQAISTAKTLISSIK